MAATLELADECLRMGCTDEAISIVRQLASAGEPRALYVLADLMWGGHLVPRDPKRARELFELAAARGDPRANMIVTNLLASGIAGGRDWGHALDRLATEGGKIAERQAAADLIASMNTDARGDPLDRPAGRMLAERPFIKIFENVLTEAECDYLIQKSEPRFEPSLVVDRELGTVKDPIRTSDGASIHWLIEDPAIHALNRRVAAVTRTEYENGEALQVLRYSEGQEYRPHFDFVPGTTNPRLWTALLYLNDDYEGGLTAFMQADLAVRGRRGDMLLFANATEDGKHDPLSEHAGESVRQGRKYLATRWVRAARWIP